MRPERGPKRGVGAAGIPGCGAPEGNPMPAGARKEPPAQSAQPSTRRAGAPAGEKGMKCKGCGAPAFSWGLCCDCLMLALRDSLKGAERSLKKLEEMERKLKALKEGLRSE